MSHGKIQLYTKVFYEKWKLFIRGFYCKIFQFYGGGFRLLAA